MKLTAQQLSALQAVAAGRVWRWTSSGAWSRGTGAHANTLTWLLRRGLIVLVASQPRTGWADAVLTKGGREALASERVPA